MPKWAVSIQASVGYWTGKQVNTLLWCSVMHDVRHAFVRTEYPRNTKSSVAEMGIELNIRSESTNLL